MSLIMARPALSAGSALVPTGMPLDLMRYETTAM